MKKHNRDVRDLIYVHLNQPAQYVMSCGIEFREFAAAFSEFANHLLLLKHQFDDGDFNRHTRFEYVPRERIGKLAREDIHAYGDFCWVDFAEEEGLNELNGQEIAELLYLGHLKHHLRTPFYNQLDNRFVYLAHDDGWFNKTYYRSFTDFFSMLGYVIPLKLGDLKLEKTLFGIKKRRSYPIVNKELLISLVPYMKEGICISIKDAELQRGRVEIPVWVIGDFANMDDMVEAYSQSVRKPCHAKIVFDKKTKEWKLFVI
ncbi:hypothetical protein D1B31_19550 [Neobacillus notoginsengisoli]|uniref:Oxalate:formate antiporter n=1 Tax=Neobacillus notoginsengisoli TaxID=1578198 RepID=A0A417YN75_9BACI|nr:hypothetical protein [Neobacillus notoginsengisoli]RHW34860.1 hypothetical protein D1B31_19550 [Neobacillus notoginsengisoli]